MMDPSDPSRRPVDPDQEDQRATPSRYQDGQADRTGAETPGDLDAPDIVGPSGEEMPVQHHDDVDGDDDRTTPSRH